MSSSEPTSEVGETDPLSLLMTPWIDKVIALIAMIPFIWTLYVRLRSGSFDIPRAALTIQAFLFVGTMIFRKTPVRISKNPWIWVLTLVETYWVILTFIVLQRGHRPVPVWVSGSLATFAALWMIWARLSLGRSIGLVPALRALVSHGPYQYVRHPIYLGGSLVFVANALSAYTPRNLVILALGVFWFALKCLAEESFLRTEPQYAEYAHRVRWRLVPGVF